MGEGSAFAQRAAPTQHWSTMPDVIPPQRQQPNLMQGTAVQTQASQPVVDYRWRDPATERAKARVQARRRRSAGGETANKVQLKAAGIVKPAAPVGQVAASGFQGAAQPLPHLGKIERSFGRPMGHVQAYIGGSAAQACNKLGAEAYASGGKVAFKQAPSAALAGHEAAHIVQQDSGKVRLSGAMGQPGDQYEREADAVGDKVASGQSAVSLLQGYGSASQPAEGKHMVEAPQLSPETGIVQAYFHAELTDGQGLLRVADDASIAVAVKDEGKFGSRFAWAQPKNVAKSNQILENQKAGILLEEEGSSKREVPIAPGSSRTRELVYIHPVPSGHDPEVELVEQSEREDRKFTQRETILRIWADCGRAAKAVLGAPLLSPLDVVYKEIDVLSGDIASGEPQWFVPGEGSTHNLVRLMAGHPTWIALQILIQSIESLQTQLAREVIDVSALKAEVDELWTDEVQFRIDRVYEIIRAHLEANPPTEDNPRLPLPEATKIIISITQETAWDKIFTDGAPILGRYHSLIEQGLGETFDFDKAIGIGRWAAPDISQAYTMASGGDIEHETKRVWNYHWAAVVVKSEDGRDTLTLENYANGNTNDKNTRWIFGLYGSAKSAEDKEGQTFHDLHRNSEQHGTAPTTLEAGRRSD